MWALGFKYIHLHVVIWTMKRQKQRESDKIMTRMCEKKALGVQPINIYIHNTFAVVMKRNMV